MKLEVFLLKLKWKRCDVEVDKFYKRFVLCDSVLKEILGFYSLIFFSMWGNDLWVLKLIVCGKDNIRREGRFVIFIIVLIYYLSMGCM